MSEKNKTNQCFNCKSYFMEDELQKIVMNSSPIVLFICNTCSSNKSKPDTETTFENFELFI
jgi:hypothetical protein